jgi:hypothetical protein
MSSRSRTRALARRHHPDVELIEARALLSALASHVPGLAHSIRHPMVVLASSVLPGASVPTAHERAREAFSARFQGPFVTGPGRFKDRSLLIHVSGGGTSNQFFHGNAIIQINVPKDPAQPVTGFAQLFAKNVATTGTTLVLDLTGTAPADPSQRPGHLTWTVDASSGGLYTAATGQGTLDLIYFPGGNIPSRAFQAGDAGAVFQGQINTTGTGNLLQFSQ